MVFFWVSCPQVQALRKFYPQLLVFGLRPSGEEVPLEGELQKTFARSLVFFDELLNFVSDLQAVIVNLVQQLGAIYTNNSPPSLYSSFTSVHLQTAFSSLADGFAVLVTIDEIVAQNLTIGHTMSLFTRMLHSVRSEPSRFGMAAEHVEELDRAVNDMDNMLITGLFQVPYSSHPFSFQLDTMNIKSMVVQGCCCCKSPQVVAC
jgi:WASH complex subunit 7